MFTDADREKISAVMAAAASNPLDMRKPEDMMRVNAVLNAQSLRIGDLVIAYSIEVLPSNSGDWRPSRHLSVSQAGQPPSDIIFQIVMREFAFSPPSAEEEWLERTLGAMTRGMVKARHAFRHANTQN